MTPTTIYFSQVAPEDLDGIEYFVYKGNNYYFKIEMYGDYFVLKDTCGREIPLDYDSSKALGTAVFAVNQILAASVEADNVYSRRINELKAIVEHMNDNS